MSSLAVALDRDALYYPYVCVRDVNWLKATLLCFPTVRRMVPYSGPLVHGARLKQLREFFDTDGARGQPLLMTTHCEWEFQRGLLEKLKENEEIVRREFSHQQAIREYGPKGAESFYFIRGFLTNELEAFLESERSDKDALAWISSSPFAKLTFKVYETIHIEWFCVHPVLGRALVSAISVAIAEEYGLSIVTDSPDTHHQVVSVDRESLFEELLRWPTGRLRPGPDDVVEDLMELVMTTAFDVRRLTPRQIADLQKDGKDLRAFKNALVPIAASIPSIGNPAERKRRLKEAAKEVLEEWRKYRKSLPRFALDALLDVSQLKYPEWASVAGGAAAGSLLHLGAAAGLAIGVVSYSGLKIWRKYRESISSPYQYLTRIAKAQSSLTFPPWTRQQSSQV
jgi:hypothetical protein